MTRIYFRFRYLFCPSSYTFKKSLWCTLGSAEFIRTYFICRVYLLQQPYCCSSQIKYDTIRCIMCDLMSILSGHETQRGNQMFLKRNTLFYFRTADVFIYFVLLFCSLTAPIPIHFQQTNQYVFLKIYAFVFLGIQMSLEGHGSE